MKGYRAMATDDIIPSRSFPQAAAHVSSGPDVDIVWIEPGFALGSRPYASQQDAVAKLGIRVVVALHEPAAGEAEGWQMFGIRYVTVPTRDWVEIPVASFDRVVDVVSTCLHTAMPVFLYCLAGINRAPTAAAAVLCHLRGMTVDEALAAVIHARAAAKPTPEQERSLRLWYRMRCQGCAET
jgi:hypothetical protein